MTTKIDLPDPSLVVLIGATGSGKSTFAARHFTTTEVISSDVCRGLVSDDMNDQGATQDAFAVLQFIADRRLARPRLTVIDATSVQREARRSLLELGRANDLFTVAIVLDMPEAVCLQRNSQRAERRYPDRVITQQRSQLQKSLRGLRREGFHRVWVLSSPEEADAVEISRTPLWTDQRSEQGPFDIVGDIHGCRDELVTLLQKLGYTVDPDARDARHPDGRRAVFVGDYGDRGPDTPGVLRLVMGMAAAGHAICLPGNHDAKLVRKLKGHNVRITHGLEATLTQLEAEPEEWKLQVRDFLDGLVSHAVLDGGRLVVAHAGMKQAYQGRSSARVRDYALYGETTGETDQFGLPVRVVWAEEYRGDAAVVYGHTAVTEPLWVNNTIDIDTGCVFGGALTALRWPERELLSVSAGATYYEPTRPLPTPPPPSSDEPGTDQENSRAALSLDVDDIAGKRIIRTRLAKTVTIREENAAAAMEVMSRYGMDPRWLIYLPPTMTPTATSQRDDALEYPTEAFAAYRNAGLAQVICEEKHMGSRAIAVICRTAEIAAQRFGTPDGEQGAIYTRTGRPFFDATPIELIEQIASAATRSGLWEAVGGDWVVLDCELLPWSAKALGLIQDQYAAVGSAAQAGLSASIATLQRAADRGLDVGELLSTERSRLDHVDHYVQAYGRYVGPATALDGITLAPFQILAGEAAVFAGRPHTWHLELADRLVGVAPEIFTATRRQIVDLADPTSIEAGCAWWEALTAAGGEGMVVKPLTVDEPSEPNRIQPGIKVRGSEYLRIIYGPEYLDPSQISRLRGRRLNAKRSLATREHGLGIEALDRFVAREPLHRVHECVFGVLALESEPVDPRL